MMLNSLPFEKHVLEQYLAAVLKMEVEVTRIRELTDGKHARKVKGFGYGQPLSIELLAGGQPRQIVLHTVRPDKYGHERRSDRARNILLDFDTYNKLPQHVPCLDVGAFTIDGKILSLAESSEFFLLTQYTPGRLFAHDLIQLLDGTQLIPEDKTRVTALADYLVQIHAKKGEDPTLYRRCIRDLFGHGEGIFGLTDSYAPDFSIAPPSRLLDIERRLVDWRWHLKERTHRLSQVHGDFHPWNILFHKDNRFHLLDRSRGEWGEPADDVSALSINFIFFSLQQYGAMRGVYKILFDLFWEHYMQNTHDVEISSVIQPYYAWRALVLAHPTWYPNIGFETRQLLFNFIENVLEDEWFDPLKINDYLEVKGIWVD